MTRRENRVVVIGGIIVVAIVVFRFAMVPFGARWFAREERIAASAETLERMRTLVAHDSSLRMDLARRQAGETTGRLISGRTTALAGSALQVLIKNYADRSRVTINRLDLAGAPDSANASPLPGIPVTVAAIGDVYGLSEFLALLQAGNPVMQVRQLTVVSNSSLRGGLLQMSFQITAPAVIE